MVDGSNESLYHADEEMHPLVRTFSPSQTIFQNLDVLSIFLGHASLAFTSKFLRIDCEGEKFCIRGCTFSSHPSLDGFWQNQHLDRFANTSKFWKIVCEGEKVRARGCISSSAWYKLSFEPSTTSVRFVL